MMQRTIFLGGKNGPKLAYYEEKKILKSPYSDLISSNMSPKYMRNLKFFYCSQIWVSPIILLWDDCQPTYHLTNLKNNTLPLSVLNDYIVMITMLNYLMRKNIQPDLLSCFSHHLQFKLHQKQYFPWQVLLINCCS